MRIQPVNLYNNLNTNPLRKQQSAQKSSTPDMFVKSPTFGTHIELLPFFEGSIPYTPENIEKFNKILKNTKLSEDALCILIEVAKRFANKIRYYYNKEHSDNFNFNIDFLFHKMNIDEITTDKDTESTIYYGLAKIKLSEEDYPKINQLMNSFLSKRQNQKFALSSFISHSFVCENLPLLNFLFKNDCEYIKKYNYDDNKFTREIICLALSRSKESKNPEIKEKFSWNSLRHLVKDYSAVAGCNFYDPRINIDVIETIPQRGLRSLWANKIADRKALLFSRTSLHIYSRLPMLDIERKTLAYPNDSNYLEYQTTVLNLMGWRIQNIVGDDGFDTPANILKCLKKPNMSEEMLTKYFNGKTLIEEIARTTMDENNQKIMQEIIDELSKYPHLKENESYRKAGVLAAKQGNVALLKFFDSRHIHYANNLKEPIESFPKEVQEILKNAKIADERIFEYAYKPEVLELFLQQNPKVDINTTNENGETLLMVTADKCNLDMFSLLANREDVDVNMVDKYGENILMRILNQTYPDTSSVKEKEIEILRNLPTDRFDVNYVNYTPVHREAHYPYSALSKLVSASFIEHRVQGNLISELLKFPNIDTNFNPVSDEIPLCLTAYEGGDSNTRFNIFKQVFLHPNTIIKSADFDELLKKTEIRIGKSALELMNQVVAGRFFSDIKKLYDENGYLTLNEIEKLVNYDDFKELTSEKINVVGENIGHLLAETVVDENNPQEMKQLRSVFKKLQKCGYDFNSKDDFGVTPLAKAIECQNKPLENMFRIYGDED